MTGFDAGKRASRISIGSDQPFRAEAEWLPGAFDQMIVQVDIEEAEHVRKSAGCRDICLTGRGKSRGVPMPQDEAGARRSEQPRHEVTQIDEECLPFALKGDSIQKPAVRIIEVERAMLYFIGVPISTIYVDAAHHG